MLMPWSTKGQVALEFIVVYSVVLIIFVVVFTLVTSQRATSLSQQQNSFLQILTQDVASQINVALASGSGYSYTITLPSSVSSTPYALYISSAGVVTANMSIGSQVLGAQASSFARSLAVNGTPVVSGGQITLYRLLTATGSLQVYNYLGTVYINMKPPGIAGLLGGVTANFGYTYPTQLTVHATSMSGASFGGARIGLLATYFISSNAAMRSFTAIANSNGNATIQIPQNGLYHNMTGSVYTLGLNGSVGGSLLLWLPMFTGVNGTSSNTVFDMSGDNGNGIIASNSGIVASLDWLPVRNNVTSVSVAQFNGHNSLITLGPVGSGLGSAGTLTAWVYLPSQAVGASRDVVGFHNSTGKGFELVINSLSPPLFYTRYDTSSASDCSVNQQGASQPNSWYFVTIAYNLAKGFELTYVNGVPGSQANCGGSLPSTFTLNYIGAGAYASDWLGNISNVQLYNTSLSLSQISALYNEGPEGLPAASSGLVSWWPLMGDANDYSHNADNGNSVSVTFNAVTVSSNSMLYMPNMTGGYGSYASKISSSKLGVNSLTLSAVNFTVNQWFMVSNSAAQGPIVDIYNGTANLGVGGGQGFDFAGSWAGGPNGNFTWIEYGPVNAQKCSTASGTVKQGAWYDAMVSVSEYTGITIYLDGQPAASCTFTASSQTLSQHSSNLMLGVNDNPVSGITGHALVSDIEVYGAVLGKQQAEALYSLGLPLYRDIQLP